VSVALPTSPGPAPLVPSLVRAGNDLVSPLSQAVQRLNRLGDRFAFQVTLPPMKRDDDAQKWVSRLLQAFATTATLNYPQPPAGVGTPGAPVCNGTSSGTSLAVRGLTAGYTIKEGQVFSIIHAGKRYLHMAAADAEADGDGVVTVTVVPALRIATADLDVIEIAQPVIEGFVGGAANTWTINVAQTIGLTFTLMESQ